MRLLTICLAAMAAFLPGAAPATPMKARLDALLAESAASDSFSGTVLIAKGGDILYAGAAGQASREYDRPNTIDTQFSLGSANKPLTAVAVMRLVEQGKLGLDTTIDTYLGGEWIPIDQARRITVRHLLAHRSGLGDYLDRAGALPCRVRLEALDDFKPLLADMPLEFEPGSQASYSNAGFLLLGAVIEKVTGEPYDAHIRRTLLEPLGMERTAAIRLDEGFSNLAQRYTVKTDSEGGATRWLNNNAGCARRGGPAGGYYSTAPDMLTFAAALRDGRLVRPETLALMRTAQGADNPGYGLGLTIRGGHIGHSGAAPGVSTRFRVYPDGHVVIILSNLTDAAPDMARRIADAVGIGG